MSIENEQKYVIFIDGTFEHKVASIAAYRQKIVQHYFDSVRARSTKDLDTDDESFTFTYKKLLKNGENLEIDPPISKEDYDLLIQESETSLTKRRYKVLVHEGNREDHWDIDFFLDTEGKIYFCMAEVEMPPGETSPIKMLDLITDQRHYKVPKGDRRFTSHSMCDVEYARKLYESL